MHLVSEALAFFEHGTQSPVLHPAIEQLRSEKENQSSRADGSEMTGTPPWRTRKQSHIVGRAQEKYEGCEILGVFRVHYADTTKTEKAVRL
jgi:hypothetical protein